MARRDAAPQFEVVKKLEGRELKLVSNAAAELATAVERLKQVQADGLKCERHFQVVLELVTGEDPKEMEFDFSTAEVLRPKKRTGGRKRRATTKNTKNAKGGK